MRKADICSNPLVIRLFSSWGYRILNKLNRQSRARMEGISLKKRDYTILTTIALFVRRGLESWHPIIHYLSCPRTVGNQILKLRSLRHGLGSNKPSFKTQPTPMRCLQVSSYWSFVPNVNYWLKKKTTLRRPWDTRPLPMRSNAITSRYSEMPSTKKWRAWESWTLSKRVSR